jgi:TRAP-type mannitol/chloroaromatic compound transport system permease small subunit
LNFLHLDIDIASFFDIRNVLFSLFKRSYNLSESETKASVPQRRTPRRFSFEMVISVMNSIGTAWVFVLLVIINLDIGGRALFNHPIRGVPEIVALSIVACVFLQIAHTLKVGRLTRSDILLNWLQARHPAMKHILEAVYYLIGGFLMAILFKASIPLFTKAWRIDEYVGAQGDFMAPVWPVKLIILIGCAAGAIQFLLMAIDSLKQLKTPENKTHDSGGGTP